MVLVALFIAERLLRKMEEKLVALAGGLTVPTEAFQLAHGLLNRGLELRQDGDRLRVIGPDGEKPELSDDEVSQIKRYKLHVLALLAYRAQA